MEQKKQRALLEIYGELIRLRKTIPALANPDKESLNVWSDEKQKILAMKRRKDNSQILALFNFNKADILPGDLQYPKSWKKVLDSSDRKWRGPGTPLPERIPQDEKDVMKAESFVLYISEDEN